MIKLSTEILNAQLNAIVDFISDGSLVIYASDVGNTSRPSVVIPLEWPCGVVEDGTLTFNQTEGLIRNPIMTWARIYNKQGLPVLDAEIGTDIEIDVEQSVIGGKVIIRNLTISYGTE